MIVDRRAGTVVVLVKGDALNGSGSRPLIRAERLGPGGQKTKVGHERAVPSMLTTSRNGLKFKFGRNRRREAAGRHSFGKQTSTSGSPNSVVNWQAVERPTQAYTRGNGRGLG